MHGAGGLHLIRAQNSDGLRILMHHRFPAGQQASLEAQCAHIRKYYHPISLTEVGQRLRSGQAFPPNSLAITIDDGYRDFFDTGYAIFQRYGIPVTMYLVTDFLDGKDWLWMDRIKYAIAQSPLETLELPLAGEIMRLPLGTAGQRDRASHLVRERAKRIPHGELLQLIESLPRLLRVKFPGAPPAGMAPLRWDEVRQIDRQGVEFGAHTKSHPILANVWNRELVREEIAGSKRRIEAELGHPVEHFCYPSGQAVDVSEAAMDSVREAGFATAVTSEIGLAQPGDDPLMLHRIGVDPSLPAFYFHELAAGFAPTLRPLSRAESFHARVRAAARTNGSI